MSTSTIAGITLVLSTLIYHAGLVYLFARAQFGDVLPVPRNQKLLIIAKHTREYRLGCRVILIGWILATLGYVNLTVLLRDGGDPIISLLALVLFLAGIVSAIIFWVLHVSPTILAAQVAARTSTVPECYEMLQQSADSSLQVYVLLTLLATVGFGWALLQTGILPNWVGWVTLGWGALWIGVTLRTSEGIPLLPMVIQVVIGISLLFK